MTHNDFNAKAGEAIAAHRPVRFDASDNLVYCGDDKEEPLGPCYPDDCEPPPTMAEYKALADSIRVALEKHYAQRVRPWVYFSMGIGVGIVLGLLLSGLIF